MIDIKTIDELTDKFVANLPASLRTMKSDVEKQLRQTMMATFAKMDLVTREEFDIQSAVLERTREKLEALEAKLAELETHIK